MDEEKRKQKTIGWPSYLVAILMLVGIGFLFLPILGTRASDGTYVSLHSFYVYFGGLQMEVVNGVRVTFPFSFNVWFLVLLSVFVLAFLAVLFGRKTPANLTVGLFLLLAGTISLFFSPQFLALGNPSMNAADVSYDYGLFLAVFCFVLSILFLVILIVRSKRYWRKRRRK